jgi:hypothetical protein
MPQPDAPLVCNLDRGGARLRGRIGAVLAVGTAITLVLVLRDDVARPWRLVVFPLAYGAAIGFLQARAST